MKSIKVKLIGEKFPFDIDLYGTKIEYMKERYIVIPNLGLKVDKIIINDKEYTDFKYCHWSELIIVRFNDEYVYKSFPLRHIDHSDKLFINDNKASYIKQEYLPINMIESNPNILYYNVKCKSSETGVPLYNKNKLYGIVIRNNKDNVYILPVIYILNSIKKEDTNIYTYNTSYMKQIGRYKIYDNMIFSAEFNYYIKLDAYLNLFFNKENTKMLKNLKYNKLKTHEYNNSHILHYCKYFDQELLVKIIQNQNDEKKLDIVINGMESIYIY